MADGGSYPKKSLKGFQGYLHTDAYAGYDKVEKVIWCDCWAHVRRKFVDAMPKGTESLEATAAAQGIQFCNQLFEMEKNLKELLPDQRYQERLTKEIPMLDAFGVWAESVQHKLLPKSKTSEALLYAFK